MEAINQKKYFNFDESILKSININSSIDTTNIYPRIKRPKYDKLEHDDNTNHNKEHDRKYYKKHEQNNSEHDLFKQQNKKIKLNQEHNKDEHNKEEHNKDEYITEIKKISIILENLNERITKIESYLFEIYQYNYAKFDKECSYIN
jgi:hypothetical protein